MNKRWLKSRAVKRSLNEIYHERVISNGKLLMLNSKHEIDESAMRLKRIGVNSHHDKAKNWDLLLTLSSCSSIDLNEKILDAGSGSRAVFAQSMVSLGFKELHACDFQQVVAKGISIERCDLVNTPYPNDYFTAIGCLSVIEHGVNLVAFAHEMFRITKKGGKLIVSTDFWPLEEDYSGKFPYGIENPQMYVFSNESLKELLDIFNDAGWKTPDYKSFSPVDPRPVIWDRMKASYTFLWLEFNK